MFGKSRILYFPNRKTLLLYIWSSICLFLGSSTIQHPLKLSTTSIEIQKDKTTFQTRLFADDLSECMKTISKNKYQLNRYEITEAQKMEVSYYFENNFILKNQNQVLKTKVNAITSDFSDPDASVIVVQGEIENGKNLFKTTELLIKNTLLFSCTPEQKNIVNVKSKKSGTKVLIFNYDSDLDFLKCEIE